MTDISSRVDHTAKAFDGLNDIVLAVRAGENDHTHSRRHATKVPTAGLAKD